MANRNWSNGGKVYTMHVMPVLVNVNITIGATGAVSSITGPSVSSVTRVSTGIYRLNLADNFNTLLFASGSAQSPVSGLSNVLAIEIQNAPSASVSILNAATLTIKTLDAAGALVDPASGSVISCMAMMNNSSVKS